MSLLVLALLAAAEPLPTLDAFLDGDAHAPRSIDVDAWAARALKHGVRFFPGSAFSPTGRRLHALRLGFAHLNEAELTEAVRRLARARS